MSQHRTKAMVELEATSSEHQLSNTELTSRVPNGLIYSHSHPSTSQYICINRARCKQVPGNIVSGEVGLDAEYTKRSPTTEEKLIKDALSGAGGSKRAAILGWQIVETKTGKFSIAWDNIGLRLVQLAHENTVWVLDMWKIRGERRVYSFSTTHLPSATLAIPKELRRILTSQT